MGFFSGIRKQIANGDDKPLTLTVTHHTPARGPLLARRQNTATAARRPLLARRRSTATRPAGHCLPAGEALPRGPQAIACPQVKHCHRARRPLLKYSYIGKYYVYIFFKNCKQLSPKAPPSLFRQRDGPGQPTQREHVLSGAKIKEPVSTLCHASQIHLSLCSLPAVAYMLCKQKETNLFFPSKTHDVHVAEAGHSLRSLCRT